MDFGVFDLAEASKQAQKFVKRTINGESALQKSLRESTTSQPWSVPNTQLYEIAKLSSSSPTDRQAILKHCWRELEEKHKWRKVYKVLNLLEVLLKRGNRDTVEAVRDAQHQHLRRLRDYHCYDEHGVDRGDSVREKSSQIVELLSDGEQLSDARKAAKRDDKVYVGMGSHDRKCAGFGSDAPKSEGGGASGSGGRLEDEEADMRRKFEEKKKRREERKALEKAEREGDAGQAPASSSAAPAAAAPASEIDLLGELAPAPRAEPALVASSAPATLDAKDPFAAFAGGAPAPAPAAPAPAAPAAVAAHAADANEDPFAAFGSAAPIPATADPFASFGAAAAPAASADPFAAFSGGGAPPATAAPAADTFGGAPPPVPSAAEDRFAAFAPAAAAPAAKGFAALGAAPQPHAQPSVGGGFGAAGGFGAGGGGGGFGGFGAPARSSAGAAAGMGFEPKSASPAAQAGASKDPFAGL